jgi:CheY-like chemotaxis protein
VVILDSELGAGTSGLETCRDLKSLPDPPKILVYTAQNSREDVAAALAGADAHLHKGMK